MMVSRLTLIIPTMCIRSLGLEGNFCFNKSWAVKSITALAICRKIVTQKIWFFIKTLSSSLGLEERLEEGEKESTKQLCPLFLPWGEYIVVHLEFESVVDVEFVDSVVDFHVSLWDKVTKQAWSSTCTKRAPPPRQVWVRRGRTLRQRTGSSESSPSFGNNHLYNTLHGADKVKICTIHIVRLLMCNTSPHNWFKLKNSPHGLRGWDTQSSQLPSASLAPLKMSSVKKALR